jgi:DNA polymerase III epsilon subunit-like protein
MSSSRRLPVTHLCVFDMETTGLDVWLGGAEPIELAAIMLDMNQQEVGRFPARLMSVQHPELASPRALEVNGKTIQQIMAAESPAVVFNEFAGWMHGILGGVGRAMPVGHNVQFDIQFMKWAFNQYLRPLSYDNLFDYHSIDSFQIAFFKKVQIERSMKYTQLTDLTRFYGIIHDAHQAMGDVEATVEVLKRFTAETRDEIEATKTLKLLQEATDRVASIP